MTSRRPVVVTGMPRSGTSWVGKILQASRQLVYVNEPMNPQHPPGHSPGVLNARIAHRYQYICADNESPWIPAFADTVALRYQFLAELAANRRPYDLGRMVKYGTTFTLGRLTSKRALIDDPFALLSVPWLVDRFESDAIILVRDPVAIAGSWHALGYVADMHDLLNQPTLLRDYLTPYEADLRRMHNSDDTIGRLCTLWRALHGAVAAMQKRDGVFIYRYEDIVRAPQLEFRRMYSDCNLSWNERTKQWIAASTSADGKTGAHPFKGLSKTAYRPMTADTALNSSRTRLTKAEIARVRDETADVRALFYSDDE
jgi:hypothetical protein